MTMPRSQRKFIADASSKRIWDFIGEAMFSALKLEGVRVMDASNFSAVIRVRLGPVKMPLSIAGRFIETSPAKSLAATVEARGLAGIIWLNQRLNITLNPLDENKTEVNLEVITEGMGNLVKTCLSWRIKSFVNEILGGMERELRQLG